MNNKSPIHFLILIFTILLMSCHGRIKEESKSNIPEGSLSLAYTGKEQYFTVDTSQSVVTWKGSMLVGANSHTGYVYISKGDLMVENNQLKGGTVVVDMNTIEDDNHGKDNNLVNHLKDGDFFDVVKFPFSTIAITRVVPVNADSTNITGNLTIKGFTHEVSFPARTEFKDGIMKANARLVIDRTKWDVRYKSGKFYDLLADQTMSDSIRFDIKIVAKGS